MEAWKQCGCWSPGASAPGDPAAAAQLIPYSQAHVVYALVSVRRGAKAYVGVPSTSAWERHRARLAEAAGDLPDTELCPLTLHLRQIGAHRAAYEYYILVLEYVPPPAGMTSPDWAYRFIKPIVKFWVATLHTACGYMRVPVCPAQRKARQQLWRVDMVNYLSRFVVE